MCKYLKENPGRSPLDMVRGLDWAHALVLVANGEDKWKRAADMKKYTVTEQAKYDNWEQLEGDDRDKYRPVRERFTSSGGSKKEFCNTLFNDEGRKMMHDEEKNWDNHMNDKAIRKWCDTGLRQYCKKERYYVGYLVDKENERKAAIQHAKKVRTEQPVIVLNKGMTNRPLFSDTESGEDDGNEGGDGTVEVEEDEGAKSGNELAEEVEGREGGKGGVGRCAPSLHACKSCKLSRSPHYGSSKPAPDTLPRRPRRLQDASDWHLTGFQDDLKSIMHTSLALPLCSYSSFMTL